MLVLPIGPHDTVELFSLSSGRRGALFPDSSQEAPEGAALAENMIYPPDKSCAILVTLSIKFV